MTESPFTEEWINDNRKVFKALYGLIFKDKTPSFSPSPKELEVINVSEIRKISRLNAGALNAYVGLQTQLMAQAEEHSPARDNARKRAEMAAVFGNMQFKTADEAADQERL